MKVVFEDLNGELFAGLHAKFAHVHPYTIIPLAVLAVGSLALVFVVERDLRSTRSKWTWAAAALAVGILVVTGAVLVPSNLAIQEWTTAGVPHDWQAVKDQWTFMQGVRTLFNVAAFLCLCVAVRLPGAASSAQP